jgi:hypothetical protein
MRFDQIERAETIHVAKQGVLRHAERRLMLLKVSFNLILDIDWNNLVRKRFSLRFVVTRFRLSTIRFVRLPILDVVLSVVSKIETALVRALSSPSIDTPRSNSLSSYNHCTSRTRPATLCAARNQRRIELKKNENRLTSIAASVTDVSSLRCGQEFSALSSNKARVIRGCRHRHRRFPGIGRS